ncbi:Fe-S protein assembly co-chaperone HscB [Pedobacter aquae]|uniref:Fe-S protein assembly co-chaperone HscB n=1 Tax=Pedobacter aquae TaxID=2605747 RepID=A0A5C0VFI0_9SPHI|nr:Fe-S protein assembly co-chaperone HscB [Pedobacter aquae]QEK51425.1 Fe-S protein assembly co-chaperone HscB [Pedobacter aquae]
MNYFEFYEIPVSFHPNAEVVKRKFYALSKQYHPDFYVNESEDKQQEILDLSTLNNKAYQVLSHEQKRLNYVLELFGALEEGEKYALPQDFLMEMMEVNEVLMELEFDEDFAKVEQLKKQVAEIEESLDTELASLTHQFDEQKEEERKALLLQIKDIYYRKKYLLRIRESINRFATPSLR